jgi:hypothetical protein
MSFSGRAFPKYEYSAPDSGESIERASGEEVEAIGYIPDVVKSE